MLVTAALLLTIAAVDAPDVSVHVSPRPALIAADSNGQSLSVDLIVENRSAEALDVDQVQISVFDRSGKLVLRKFIDGNGTRPSIRTADVSEVPAGATALLFNPFHEFAPDVELHTVKFDLKLSSKDGSRRYAESATVTPEVYRAKARLILPVQARMIVYDGHDFYAHHRRWDYTIPGLQQLGFRTNFMRYESDLSGRRLRHAGVRAMSRTMPLLTAEVCWSAARCSGPCSPA